MKIGISSATFYPMPTELAVEEIIQLGFSHVELFLNSESEFSLEFLTPIKTRLDEAGITVVSVHSYSAAMEGIYFFGDYERRVKDSIEIYRRYFTAAGFLGARYFTFHGDRNIKGVKEGMQISFERHCEVLSRLSDAAEEHGVLLSQENVSWCMSAYPEYLKALKAALGKKIGFTLDLKQARRAGIPWQNYVEVMGDQLVNIHISDFDEKHPSLLCGQGKMDYHQFYDSLSKNSYTGAVILEVYSTDYDDIRQIQDAREYIVTNFCG